jgi:fatty-acyl-CoA synthase
MSEKEGYQQNLLRRQAIGDFLRRTAKKHPNKLVLAFKNKKFTYREFDEAVNRTAHALTALGLKKGDALAIMSQNCYQMALLMWACFKTGIWYAPVNYLLRGPEIIFQLNHCEAFVFIVESAFLEPVKNVTNELKTVEKFGLINLAGIDLPPGWFDVDELLSGDYPDSEPEVIINGDDPASIIYTSGTTAAPKGALIQHCSYFSQCASFLSAAGPRITEQDVWMMNIPLFHIGASSVFVACAKGGATIHGTYGIDPIEAMELIQKEKITCLIWPPTLYTGLLGLNLEQYDLNSLRKCVWFGGSMPLDALEKWMKLCPQAVFGAHWSQTEINITGTLVWLDDHKLPDAGNIIGKPLLDTEIRIVDADDKDVPPGQPGEIVIRSPSVMLSYYKDAERTAETIRNGWLHTGDVGRLGEDGNYYFVDRVKDMVKTGGENVSCLEVEEVLNSHPDVQVSAVFGIHHPYWIEGVTAVVIPASNNLTEDNLSDYAQKHLAKYKVPKKFILIKYEQLPVSPTGKILRKELRVLYKDIYKDVKGK